MTDQADKAAIVGVAKLSSGTISLTQRSGGTVDLSIDGRTRVTGPKGVAIVSQIKTGDLVAAIATTSGQASASAKKVAQKLFVGEASRSASQTKKVVSGVVTGVNASQITLLQKNEADTFYTLSASTSAVVKGKGGGEADAANITLGQRVAVVGTVDEGNIITPLLIHIVSENL